MFKKHGLKMNLDKTELMRVGKQRDELNIRLEEKYIKQVNILCILVEIYLRTGEWSWRCNAGIQAGANAWRNVEGVMWTEGFPEN